MCSEISNKFLEANLLFGKFESFLENSLMIGDLGSPFLYLFITHYIFLFILTFIF